MFEILTQITIKDEQAEVREVFPKKSNEQILWQWQQSYQLYLEKLSSICSAFFYKDQRRKDGNDFKTDTVSGFQNTPELKRAKTYRALSFDRINLFNMANLFSISWKPFVMCYCFREPIKTFFFFLACPALVSGPPNHLLASFFGLYCKLIFFMDLWPTYFASGP